MSSQTWLLSIFLVLLNNSAFHVTALDSLHCLNDKGNYSRNSIYGTNLKALLSSLSSKIGNSGYYKASEGQSPDKANAEALCRADIQLDTCRSCVQNISGDLLHSCPNQKQAILYRDLCMIRYSNESFFGMRADSPGVIASSVKTVRLPDQFVENLRPLLDDLRFKTASGGPIMKVASGNHTAPALQTIYAMLQCVPDISTDDCSGCLSAAVQEIPDCCYDAELVKIVRPSCNFMYDVSEFYNTTRIQEAERLSGAATVRAPVPPVPSPPGNGDVTTTRIVIIIVVPVVCLIVIATCVGICIRKSLSKAPKETISIDEISTVESLQHDFGKIRAATNDFSDLNKLGQGGFGAVFKGKLQNGQEIAVKRLTDGLGQGDQQFKNEVLLLAKLQHRNLVRLLGFALEGKERLLVYEFIQNKSLDHFIFDPIKRSCVDWNTRYKFIVGIARGLLYLHEDSRFRIIHCDLKASNILLDGNMNPKIADFGMARLCAQDENEGNTSRIVGTYGYMAPEYAMYGQFSVKIDVFSFGVLVLEIISGQKISTFQDGENQEDMLNYVWRNWRERTTTNIIDPVLRSTSNSLRDIFRCIHIGLLCVQENPTDRPTMASIVLMLNSFSATLPIPLQPAFFSSGSQDRDTSHLRKSDLRELGFHGFLETKFGEPSHTSKNDASITELYPR